MTESHFWPHAWHLRRALQRPPDATNAPALVDDLKRDWNLQWYAFADSNSIDAAWLLPFSEQGLFQSPPEVERRGSTVTARGWPALQFLRLRVEDHPAEVASVIKGLDSDNWWVISDCLEIASSLPQAVAVAPVVRYLNLWASAPVSWTRADLLTDSIGVLVHSSAADASVSQAVFLVGARLLKDRELEYEYEEQISPWLVATPRRTIPEVLDGIEAALAISQVDINLPGTRRYRRHSGPAGLLLDTWLAALDREPIGSTLVRAVALYDSSSASRRSMGLLALDRVLSDGRVLAGSLDMLKRCVSDLAEEDDWSVHGSRVEVIARHFERLGDDDRGLLLRRARTLAASEERADRYAARDLLSALEHEVGPEERVVLQELVDDLGPTQKSSELLIESATVVRSESAVQLDDLLRMSAIELGGVVRHPPIASTRSFYEGPNLEGLGIALRACVQARFEVLLPDLAGLAQAAQDTTIGHSLVWGAREAVRSGSTPAGGQAHLLDFMEEMCRLVDRWSSEEVTPEPLGYGVQTVTRGLADLLEEAAEWIFVERSQLGERIAKQLAWLLASPDPSDDYERDYGGTNMDPPTLAINSTRGSALLVTLKFLSFYWGAEGAPEDQFRSDLERSILEVCANERSPAVRSGLGMYLSQIATFWPSLLDEHAAELLPPGDDDVVLWEAVFATYLRFQHPFRPTARRLREHFECAIERMGSEQCPYLESSAERLITHLIVLAMPRADDSDEWLDLLYRALDQTTDEAAAQGINDLAHAARNESLDVPDAWFEGMISHRSASLRGRSDRSQEASALMGLAMSVPLPVARAVGLLIGLMEAGAKPRSREVVEYLSATNSGAPQAAASVLTAAINHGVFDRPTFYPDDGLVDLLQTLSVDTPDSTWELVNRLGQVGLFAVEQVAQDLYERLAD